MSRVLLVNMPFGNLRWPNLGLGLLKASLARRDIACDVAYFNFDFAELVGLDHYHWLADHFAFVLGGERLFAKHYFHGQLSEKGDSPHLPERPCGCFAQMGTVPFFTADAEYYRDVLLATDSGMTDADHAAFLDTARHIEPFLDRCIAAVDWSCYDVVGFTASFQQTMPSLCLAQRIKRLHPEIAIVVGGAACEGCMGPELLRQFPEIDCVFSGEADVTFPDTIERWIHERHDAHEENTAGTSRERACVGWGAGMVENLDELPYPDFDDYFARHAASPLRNQINPLLFFETSRGCWWGKKCRCKFCGLNGDRLGYRSKSPAHAIDELRHLVDRYDIHRACAADNVLDLHYFESLLPMLKAANLDLSFSFEMKTNLRRPQIEALRQAGLGAAQLGIESFSTPVLRLIGKGATAMQNLQALRWFSEARIDVEWNLLYGFPGEDPAEYAAMAKLLPSLCHLAPPQAVGRVRVDRFSPYFEHPEQYGLVHLRPTIAFQYVYPFPRDVLDRLAYYFDYDYADRRDPLAYAQPVLDAAAVWQELAGTVSLRYWDRSDGVLILTDTRPGAEEFQRRLTNIDRAIYLFCDTGRSFQQIVEHIAAAFPEAVLDESMLLRTLSTWVDARLMAHLDGRYLSLAVQSPPAS